MLIHFIVHFFADQIFNFEQCRTIFVEKCRKEMSSDSMDVWPL